MRLLSLLALLFLVAVVGCAQPVQESPASVTPNSGDHADHDHADHDHAEDHAHDEHADHEHGDDHDHADHDEHGDHDHGEADEHGSGDKNADEQASTEQPEVIRFVADKSLSIPDMMCPYSCWPRVKETLATQPGVEGVQLAEQPEDAEEGEIKERVVELKLSEGFDEQAAIAALGKIDFKAEVIN